jgi:putative membrane protein
MKKATIWLLFLSLILMAGTVFAVTAKDKEFVEKAAKGGMMEVQLGKYAEENAKSEDVKKFGSRMAEDHGKANDELKQLAGKKGIKVPDNMGSKHQATMDRLKKVSGAEFDKAYMKEMVKDHTKDVSEFRKAGKNLPDKDLREWANKTLPVLEEHLQQAKEISAKVGAKTSK